MDSDFSGFARQLPFQPSTNQELIHPRSSLTALLHSDDYDFHSLDYGDPTLGFNLSQLPSGNHASSQVTSTSNDFHNLQQATNSNTSLDFPIDGSIIDSSFFYATPCAEDLNGWGTCSAAVPPQNLPMIGDFDIPQHSVSHPINYRDPVQVPSTKFIAYVPPSETSGVQCDVGKHSNKPVTAQSHCSSVPTLASLRPPTHCDTPETAIVTPATSKIQPISSTSTAEESISRSEPFPVVSHSVGVSARSGPNNVPIGTPISATAGSETANKEWHLLSADSEAREDSTELTALEDDIEDRHKTWAGRNPTKAKIPVPQRKVRKGQNNEVRKIREDEQ